MTFFKENKTFTFCMFTALEICEPDSAHAVWSAETEETCRKTICQPKDTHSGAAESLKDHSLGFLLSDRYHMLLHLEGSFFFFLQMKLWSNVYQTTGHVPKIKVSVSESMVANCNLCNINFLYRRKMHEVLIF